MNSFKFASWNLEIARRRSSDCNDYGIVFLCEPFRGNVLSDFAAGNELDAFRFENLPTAFDKRLVELEAGDAVAEKSADVGAPFVDRDRPATAAKRDRGGKPGWACADYRHLLAVFLRGWTRHHPAVIEGGLDDALL